MANSKQADETLEKKPTDSSSHPEQLKAEKASEIAEQGDDLEQRIRRWL